MNTAMWSNFLVAQVSAAAALTGLIFVAVSINLTKILEFPGVSTRAGEAILLLLGVLLICSVALVPNQPMRILGIELTTIAALLWLPVTARHLGYRRPHDHQWWWFTLRVVLCQMAMLSFCIAGVLLIVGRNEGMYWLVPGCLMSFVAGVYSAWVLLIEILR